MRAKQFFISTQKEAPADAEIVSQKLMLRAGMIRKLAAGVYNYMPMGLRSLKKIERIVREDGPCRRHRTSDADRPAC